jgi:ribosomal protein S18 acetylase RimI-like enzyme
MMKPPHSRCHVFPNIAIFTAAVSADCGTASHISQFAERGATLRSARPQNDDAVTEVLSRKQQAPAFFSSESPMQIRAALPDDAEAIAEFNRCLALETEDYVLDPLRLRDGVAAVLSGAGEAQYLVAEAEGRVIGQLMLTREWSDWRNGWFYWIQSVYVMPAHRGQGVFRALYAAAVALVQNQQNAVGLRLYVEQHNAAAQQTYERLGMRPTGYRVMEHAIRHHPLKVGDKQ